MQYINFLKIENIDFKFACFHSMKMFYYNNWVVMYEKIMLYIDIYNTVLGGSFGKCRSQKKRYV